MKFIVNILLIGAFAISLQADSYVLIENEVKLDLPKQEIVLYSGVPVVVVSHNDKTEKVRISGYINKDDKYKLYATSNLKLLLATFKKSDLLKVQGEKGTLEATVPKKNITDDMDEAWAEGSDLFYDKCTKCHHAKIVKHYDMLGWDALFSSMKLKAKTTKSQNVKILRFLNAFAKDGILRESD